jgi:hypothetical protein
MLPCFFLTHMQTQTHTCTCTRTHQCSLILSFFLCVHGYVRVCVCVCVCVLHSWLLPFSPSFRSFFSLSGCLTDKKRWCHLRGREVGPPIKYSTHIPKQRHGHSSDRSLPWWFEPITLAGLPRWDRTQPIDTPPRAPRKKRKKKRKMGEKKEVKPGAQSRFSIFPLLSLSSSPFRELPVCHFSFSTIPPAQYIKPQALLPVQICFDFFSLFLLFFNQRQAARRLTLLSLIHHLHNSLHASDVETVLSQRTDGTFDSLRLHFNLFCSDLHSAFASPLPLSLLCCLFSSFEGLGILCDVQAAWHLSMNMDGKWERMRRKPADHNQTHTLLIELD